MDILGSCNNAVSYTRSDLSSMLELGIERMVELPEDVLDVVFAFCIKRFELRHIIRSSLTCKRWYSLAISSSKATTTACEPPWLMLHDESLNTVVCNKEARFVSLWGKEDPKEGGHLYDLSVGSTSDETRLPSCGWTCLTSSTRGWVLLGCFCHSNGDRPVYGSAHPLGLYNLFSKVCIQLPPYSPPIPNCCPRFYTMKPRQCLVIYSDVFSCEFVVWISACQHLSSCKLDGAPRRWVYYHNPRHILYESILFRKEEQLLCAIDKDFCVDIFMLGKYGNDQTDAELGLCLVKSTQVRLENSTWGHRMYLVESRGDVLIVTLEYYLSDGLNVWVYKLDLSDMSVTSMQSLGDQALFLGTGCPTFCVSAKDFPKVKENSVNIAQTFYVTTFSLEDYSKTSTTYGPSYDYYPHLDFGKLISPPPSPRHK